MRLVKEILPLSVRYLEEKQVVSPRFIVELLLSHVLGKTRMELYMCFDQPIEEEELVCFRSFLRKAALHMPVEYILGVVDFYGSAFFVSQDVLIPRPETEWLVDYASKSLSQESSSLFLGDLCSGSGCIGLSLKKKHPHLQVVLVDQSAKALAVSEKNAKKHQLEVTHIHGDFLHALQGKKFHYILCNPPYVTEEEYANLDPSVRDFEPKEALVSGRSGLEFYERLARELPAYLYPQAKVFLEIGKDQGESVLSLFSSWHKTLYKDLAGHDRFICLRSIN